jgi:hypothetical protein
LLEVGVKVVCLGGRLSVIVVELGEEICAVLAIGYGGRLDAGCE